MVASKYCDSTPRSQVNLSHDSSRARRAVGRYAHRGLRSSTGPRTHRALRAPIFRACPCGSTGVHSHRPQSTELYMRKAYPNSFANGAQKSTTQTCLLTRKLGPRGFRAEGTRAKARPGSASDRRESRPITPTDTRLVGLRRSLASSA